jgi:hypothetical protein
METRADLTLSTRDTMATAKSVYQKFLERVVKQGVFSPSERRRGSGALSTRKQKEIEEGKSADGRIAHLALISGKGGWHPAPEKRQRYSEFTNVTLIDHLTSVVRGAVVFAALDLSGSGVVQDTPTLRRRLTVVAVVGLLHDMDKILGLSRTDEIVLEQVDEILDRYRLRDFLKQEKIDLTPPEILALIHEVEVSRGGYLRPGQVVPPRLHRNDCLYVRLADRLDGLFLRSAAGRSLEGVLKELVNFSGMRSGVLKQGWKELRIEDPHTPFLLDTLLAALSRACEDEHGFPPLLEIHHDGVLLALVPEPGWERLVDRAIARATAPLGDRIRPNINARGKIDLLDAPGTLDNLRSAFEVMKQSECEGFLRCKIDIARARLDDIDHEFSAASFRPQWGSFSTGRLVPLWAGVRRSEDEARNNFLLDAVTLTATLCCTDPDRKLRLAIPVADVRETELRHHLGDRVPVWIDTVDDDNSRRTIIASLTAAYAQTDIDLHDAIYGPRGLAATWLEGRAGRQGLANKINPTGKRLSDAVGCHYKALLSGTYVAAQDETADGRCHFTNQPVPIDREIDGKTGLYGVKVSAFSGRDGRFEHFNSTRRHTLVSPIAEAEHRFRQVLFEELPRGRPGEVPVTISSPTTAGLFGALVYEGDQALRNFALTDLLREKVENDKPVFSELELHARRLRVARYEVMPTHLVGEAQDFGQLDFCSAVLRAARRLGRPMHLFRGLPRPNRAFVHFDFLPPSVEAFLGGRSFRVEQLGQVIQRIEGLVRIAKTIGFGPELALSVADPSTRFGAACDALARAGAHRADPSKSKDYAADQIRFFVTNLLERQDHSLMSDIDKAVVAFGEAAARIQRAPLSSDGKNVPETCLRVALEAAEGAASLGQKSRDSLVAAVAGSLSDTLARRNLFAKRAARATARLDEVIADTAALFVDQVWRGAFDCKAPASRKRRIAYAIYAWAFRRRAYALLESQDPDADGGADRGSSKPY